MKLETTLYSSLSVEKAVAKSLIVLKVIGGTSTKMKSPVCLSSELNVLLRTVKIEIFFDGGAAGTSIIISASAFELFPLAAGIAQDRFTEEFEKSDN